MKGVFWTRFSFRDALYVRIFQTAVNTPKVKRVQSAWEHCERGKTVFKHNEYSFSFKFDLKMRRCQNFELVKTDFLHHTVHLENRESFAPAGWSFCRSWVKGDTETDSFLLLCSRRYLMVLYNFIFAWCYARNSSHEQAKKRRLVFSLEDIER